MAERNDTERDTLERVAEGLEILNDHRFVKMHDTWWKPLWFQFLRGLAFGLGSAIGATLLVSMLVWWLSQIEFIPILGGWATEIIDQIETVMPEDGR